MQNKKSAESNVCMLFGLEESVHKLKGHSKDRTVEVYLYHSNMKYKLVTCVMMITYQMALSEYLEAFIER